MSQFSDEEITLLSRYVTDTSGDIFAVTDLQGIVGAVYARYSRAPGGFRETLLKEFLKTGTIDVGRAQDLIERILVAYGDDSVGELEGAHLSLENISILATKELEDRRIGGSPIEQSTRYVFYDQKGADGSYRYYRDPAVMASVHADTYVGTMDFIFQTYCELVEPMKAFYSARKPLEEAEYAIRPPVGDVPATKIRYTDCADDKERKAFRMTYGADIRTKACDTLRALLPVSTGTNVGIFGNGRFFQTALSHCYSSDLPEARDIARQAHEQLNKVIPRYVKRARPNEYVLMTRAKMQTLTERLLYGVVATIQDDVALMGRAVCVIIDACRDKPGDPEALHAALMAEEDNLMLASMLYPYASLPLQQVRELVRTYAPTVKREIVETYLGNRETRRDRPGRALESGYPYTFDLCTDFGTYKDLERHRMCTQQRQAFSPTIGFAMPPDLACAGFEDRAHECVRRAIALHALLLPEFPAQAQYATLHGSTVRWMLGINDRALMHLIELRTTPQGHPSYRYVCQQMHDLVAKRSPWRAEAMRFADHGYYAWARGDAEALQRVKEAALDSKKA